MYFRQIQISPKESACYSNMAGERRTEELHVIFVLSYEEL